jgi:hypothetical protein
VTSLSLTELQRQMMGYLTQEEQDIAEQVIDHGNISRDTRLHIYKNAYYMRFKETIEADHEILGLYLGDDLFDQMVIGYINKYPSESTSLRNFADRLPQYLKGSVPFNDFPVISELAYFERLLMVAFDAADSDIFTRALLIDIPHEHWPSLTFRFHPSVQIARFDHSAVETWQALKQENTPPLAEQAKSIWLLWRNHDRLIQFRSLTLIEYQLLTLILKGADFSELCDYLLENNAQTHISQLALNYLLTWVDDGILAKVCC